MDDKTFFLGLLFFAAVGFALGFGGALSHGKPMTSALGTGLYSAGIAVVVGVLIVVFGSAGAKK